MPRPILPLAALDRKAHACPNRARPGSSRSHVPIPSRHVVWRAVGCIRGRLDQIQSVIAASVEVDFGMTFAT